MQSNTTVLQSILPYEGYYAQFSSNLVTLVLSGERWKMYVCGAVELYCILQGGVSSVLTKSNAISN